MAKKKDILSEVSNDAEGAFMAPYIAEFTVKGTAALLFHRWSNEDVEAKGKAAKGSAAKKTDNLDAYVYQNEVGEICIPGEYVRQSLIHAAKYRQDPRSPRKSAMDLFKAGVVSLTELASLGVDEWDYLDQRRVVIQRSAITRTRPAMLPGWEATFQFQVLIPEYIDPAMLQDVLVQAGRLVGVGDFRPTYGRFSVNRFEVLQLEKAA
ncbi:MAG: hypothetical protein GXY86_00630 [Firmicutes bacterium]|nr:hypothetical protein [Bacillota bacterium]